VHTPPRILIADDNPTNLDILRTRLLVHGYDIVTAGDGENALAMVRMKQPDLVLLDVMMPKVDGLQVCRQLKSDPSLPFIPIVLVTARADPRDIVAGLEAGGDEYLTKPVDQAALVARVKSMLRIKALHDTVREQAERLEAQARELAQLNHTLERRITEQLAELERVGRLRRFLSPQLAELVVSAGDERMLESHRREITVLFCDLRGFTAFSETEEPEEVMEVLAEYHAAMGQLIFAFGGTLERFTGDGLMVFFNDPIPCAEPSAQAVRMAVAMMRRVEEMAGRWRKRGHQLGFGVGVAMGYATLGRIGFEGRFDYGAIGPVTNLASRLCDQAAPGQILVSQRVFAAIEPLVEVEPIGELVLHGFHRPVKTHNVVALKVS
jgi:adenylate cyclase